MKAQSGRHSPTAPDFAERKSVDGLARRTLAAALVFAFFFYAFGFQGPATSEMNLSTPSSGSEMGVL